MFYLQKLKEIKENEEINSKKNADIIVNNDVSEPVNQQEVENILPEKEINGEFIITNTNIPMRNIYEKNMRSSLPLLKWLPSKYVFVNGDTPLPNDIEEFICSAKKHCVVSLMIYTEKTTNNEKSKILMCTFSTLDMTIILNLRSNLIKSNSFSLPMQMISILSDPQITLVLPGIVDWCNGCDINLFDLFKDYISVMPTFPKVEYINSFYERLRILKTGKDMCEHMKLLQWVFQIKINHHLHGATILLPLTDQWSQLLHLYGTLLVYGYLALRNKEIEFRKFYKNGVNVSPMYLQDMILQYNLSTLSREDLIKKLIGSSRYPNPSLPNQPLRKDN